MANQAISEDIVAARSVSVAASALSVRVFDTLAEAEPVWRALETVAVLTPYQRFDWIANALASGLVRGGDIRVVVVTERDRPVALLPLRIARRMGLARAEIIGTAISNADWMMVDPERAGAFHPEALKAMLAEARKAGCAADLLVLYSQPERWGGVANPLLALRRTPAPNNLYFSALEPGDAPFIEQSLPHKRRTNIRRSIRRLSESFGPLSLRAGDTSKEIAAMHAVFLDQRARRFRQMGVENVFGTPAFRDFFLRAAEASLGSARPALKIHALYAGEEILATSIGTFCRDHYSQYINSTTDGPAARYTLMGVTMSMLIEELRAQGIRSIDMGLGDFDYKADWTQPRPGYDSIIPMSPLGAAAALALQGARQTKRAVKQNPALWRAAQGLRGLRTRLRETAAGRQGPR